MARLDRLGLREFRNYETLDLRLEPGLNLFVGANGQGKTNLLEAIYFLSLLRSFRTTQLRNLYRWRASRFVVQGEVCAAGVTRRLAVEYSQDRRQLRVDGQPVHRASNFINRLCCVAFVPEDIDLVKGAAGERRRFLDISLAQLDEPYLAALQDYGKALKSRNALLRRPRVPAAQLAAFEEIMARHGALLVRRRQAFIDTLAPEITGICAQFYPADQHLTLDYRASITPPEDGGLEAATDAFRQALENERPKAIERQHSTIGPHRDDIGIDLDGRDLGRFGSEGQCRLAAIVLKLATAIYVNRERRHGGSDRGVVLLVDDVMGELDQRASRAFCEALGTMDQVCMAATDTAVTPWLEPGATFVVEAGTVSRQNHQEDGSDADRQ